MGVMKPGSDDDLSPNSMLGKAKALFHQFYGVFIVVSCFAISVGLMNCMKYIYLTYQFHYPIWLTATHMAVSYLVAVAGIFLFGLVPDRRVLTFTEQVKVVVPFSVLGASSIACGNAALLFLYPSFHEMLQNLTPLWTVVCNITMKGVR